MAQQNSTNNNPFALEGADITNEMLDTSTAAAVGFTANQTSLNDPYHHQEIFD